MDIFNFTLIIVPIWRVACSLEQKLLKRRWSMLPSFLDPIPTEEKYEAAPGAHVKTRGPLQARATVEMKNLTVKRLDGKPLIV